MARITITLQPFYSTLDCVRNNPSESVPEETFIYPLTPIVVINHSLSASSIFYGPWYPCSIYMPDSLFFTISLQLTTDKAVKDFRKRLRACILANGRHFEHKL